MAVFHFDVDQGSLAWYRLRSGRPTASEFHNILTPAKRQLAAARHKYACRLIAERLMNWQADSLDKIGHIAAGKEHEPEAIKALEWEEQITTTKLGFATTNDKRFGASPDRVVGEMKEGGSFDTVVEVKSPTIPTQMEYLMAPTILEIDQKAKVAGGDDYICQVQGQLYVCEAEHAIFFAKRPLMPRVLLRTHRDEAFIHDLADALERFDDQLEKMTEAAKRLGTFEQFSTQVVTPLDAERGLVSEEELAAMLERDPGFDFDNRMGA